MFSFKLWGLLFTLGLECICVDNAWEAIILSVSMESALAQHHSPWSPPSPGKPSSFSTSVRCHAPSRLLVCLLPCTSPALIWWLLLYCFCNYFHVTTEPWSSGGRPVLIALQNSRNCIRTTFRIIYLVSFFWNSIGIFIGVSLNV